MDIIKTEDLTKNYGRARGISGINLTVRKGEIYGFIGPNGAGKSTMIKLLLNFIYPTQGCGKLFDLDIVAESREIKLRTGYVPSEVNFYSELKVSSIIKYAESFYKDIDREYVEKLSVRFEVDLDKKFGELSFGNKKKAAILQALIHQPELLILDEPTNGLDPLMQERLHETLVELKEKGTTVFLSSHNLTEVQDWCDRVAVIKEGCIVDIMDIDKTKIKKVNTVRLVSKNINIAEIERLGAENIINKENEIIFDFEGDLNTLIRLLSAVDVIGLTIQPQKLSDTFMAYYRNEEDK